MNTTQDTLENEFFHVCTKGLEKSLLFITEDDYITGMNLIPVCLHGKKGLKVLAFCLMDNHVHFILRGDYVACLKFIRSYKRALSKRFRYKGRPCIFQSGGGVLLKEMDDPLYITQAIAYVLRNPIKAGENHTPQGCRWSTARLYFADKTHTEYNSLLRYGEMPYSERRKICTTEGVIDKNWVVDDKGMILPENYVSVSEVEKMYGRATQFMYYLNSNCETIMELDAGVMAKARYSDAELEANLRELLVSRYKGCSLESLGVQARVALATTMKRRYGVTPARLSRLVGIEKEVLSKLI